MKKKWFVVCLFLLLVSLSSCKKKIELEEKEYWEGSIDDDFEDDTILIGIDKNFGERDFGVKDFKEINAIECRLLYDYPQSDGTREKAYVITLPIHSKQNVIDCIYIIREYDFVQSAEPNVHLYPD